jgi:hypothetical protein
MDRAPEVMAGKEQDMRPLFLDNPRRHWLLAPRRESNPALDAYAGYHWRPSMWRRIGAAVAAMFGY